MWQCWVFLMLPRGSTLVSTLLLQSGTYYLCGHPYPADPVGHLFESYSYCMDTLTLRTQQDILDCGSPPCVTAWALLGDCPTGAMGRTPMGYPGLIAPSVPLPRVPRLSFLPARWSYGAYSYRTHCHIAAPVH